MAIILVALALRIAYLIDISDSPQFNYPMLDQYWYDSKARDVLAGDLLARTSSFRVPLYVYFLAGCYLVFGHSYVAAVLIQMFMAAVACGLVFLITKRIFGILAGVTAGLGLAFYRMAIYASGELLPTSLLLICVLAATYFVLRSVEGQRLRDGALAGFLLGLAFLTRPDVLPFACAMAATQGVGSAYSTSPSFSAGPTIARISASAFCAASRTRSSEEDPARFSSVTAFCKPEESCSMTATFALGPGSCSIRANSEAVRSNDTAKIDVAAWPGSPTN